MKCIAVVFSFVLMLTLGATQVSAETATQVTPNINTAQLLDLVAENKGKVVMINFFAAFCPPCRKEIPGLIKIRASLSEDDFVVIGVAVDTDMKEMEEFIAKIEFNYPTYYGGPEVANAFWVNSIPHNIIYDRAGRMVVNEAGYVPEKQLRTFLENLIQAK